MGDPESELVRDILITNMMNVEIQKQLCNEYLTPKNGLVYAYFMRKAQKHINNTLNFLYIVLHKNHIM